jgi:hypothetical protein
MIHRWPILVQLGIFSYVALPTGVHGGWGSRGMHVWVGHGGSICVEAPGNLVLCIPSPLLSSVPIDPLSGSLRRGPTAPPSPARSPAPSPQVVRMLPQCSASASNLGGTKLPLIICPDCKERRVVKRTCTSKHPWSFGEVFYCCPAHKVSSSCPSRNGFLGSPLDLKFLCVCRKMVRVAPFSDGKKSMLQCLRR